MFKRHYDMFGNLKRINESKFIGEINKNAKVHECVLCGSKITSACNSHVVPQFILKEIAENGYISYGHALHSFEVGGIKKTTGISDAYTFRLICRKCDGKYFKHYENPNNLISFDSLSENDKKIILCEMALKAHLSHLNMKYRNLVMLDMVNQGKVAEMERKGELVLAERQDINEHFEYIRKLKKIMKSNKNPFVVLCDEVLDYQTKIATQTIINFNYDLKGNQVFDPFLINANNQCRYFYLMILPYKGKTRILFFIEKNNVENVQTIIDDFNKLSKSDKLHFLFVSLIIHDQQFYMSPSLADNIFKKDKTLVKLYTNTDKSISYQSKIKDFRKYKNYLLKEYNI